MVTNRHSHHESDTNFSTCVVYHTHHSGHRPIINTTTTTNINNNDNNNMSSFERLCLLSIGIALAGMELAKEFAMCQIGYDPFWTEFAICRIVMESIN